MNSDPLTLDAIGQAELVATGQISAAELVELSITDIQRVNPALNFLVLDRYDAARAEATELDRSGAARAGELPLAGVPVLLKDLDQQITGMAQTDGSLAPMGPPAQQDSHIAASYRAAGLIPVGKASAPEFANHSTTEPERYGPARNPWDLTRTTGGSSGGSAAAVAVRSVAAAGASDGAGSIRIPSSCCGTFGLKPSRGRLSTYPYPDDLLFGLSTHGTITRSVRDSALLLDIVAQPVAGDWIRLPAPAEPFAASTPRDPGRLRIGLSVGHPMGGTVHPDCVTAAERTARLLDSLGHHVELATPSFDQDGIREGMFTIWALANAAGAHAIEQSLGRKLRYEELEVTTWELVDAGYALTVEDVMRVRALMQTSAWQIGRFYDDYDLWLTPTLAQPPAPLGELNRSEGSGQAWWNYDLEFNPFNPLANLTGFPAASLPLHWNDAGLPIGSMLTAPFAAETRLLQVCAQLEAAQPWQERVPQRHP